MRLVKRILAYALAVGLALTSIPAESGYVYAQGNGQSVDYSSNKISLGTLNWMDDDREDYYFTSVSSELDDDTVIKNLCISVDNGGTFSLPSSVLTANHKTGITLNNEYLSSVSTSDELISVTFSGAFTIAQVKAFVGDLRFHRNTEDDSVYQKVCVVADDIQLGENETVLLIDGTPHYYRYVSISNDSNITWNDAYGAAKSTSINGLKGYLATVTSDYEENFLSGFIIERFNFNPTANDWMKNPWAWLGGVRTNVKDSDGFFDNDTLAEYSVDPGDHTYRDVLVNDSWRGTYNADLDLWIAYDWQTEWKMDVNTRQLIHTVDGEVTYVDPLPRKWYWACGPEAGNTFYSTNLKGGYENAAGTTGADLPYGDWYVKSPENADKGTQRQEFVLALGSNYGTVSWDDTSNELITGERVAGYLVEYSAYGNIAPSKAPYHAYRYITADEIDYNGGRLPGEEKIITITGSDFSVDMGTGFVNASTVLELGNISAKDDLNEACEVTVNPEDLLVLNERIANGPAGRVTLRLTSGNATSSVKATVVADENTDISVSVFDPTKQSTPSISVPDNSVSGTTSYTITVPSIEQGLTIAISPTNQLSTFDFEYGDEQNGVKNDIDAGVDFDSWSPGLIILNGLKEGDNGKVSVKVNSQGNTSKIYEFRVFKDATVKPQEKDITITGNNFSVKAGSAFLTAAELLTKSEARAYYIDEHDNYIDVDVSVDSADLIKLNSNIYSSTIGGVDVNLVSGNFKKPITVNVTADDNKDMTAKIEDASGGYEGKITPLIKDEEDKRTYNITVPYDVTSIKITNTLAEKTASFDTTYGVNDEMLNNKASVSANESLSELVVSNLQVGDNGDVSIKVKAQNGDTKVYVFSIVRDLCDNANITSNDFSVPFGSGFLNSAAVIKKAGIVAKDKEDNELDVTVDSEGLLALNQRIAEGPSGTVFLKIVAGKTASLLKVTVLPDSNTDASISVSDPDEKYVPKITATEKTEEKTTYTILLPADEEALSIKTALAKETSSFDSDYGIDSTGLIGDISLDDESTEQNIILSNIKAENNGKVSVKVKAADDSSMIYEFVITKAKKIVEEVIVSIEASNFTVDAGTDMLFSNDFAELANIVATDDSGNEVGYEIDADDLINLNKEIADKAKRFDRTVEVKISSGKTAKKVIVTVNPAELDPEPDMTYEISDATDVTGSLSDKITHTLKTEAGQYIINITVPYDVKGVKIANSVDTESGVEFDTTYDIKTSDLKAGAKVLEGSTPSDITVKDLQVGDNGSVSVKVKTVKDKTRIYTFNITRDLCDNANISADNFDVPFGSNFLNASDIIKKASIKAFDKDENELAVTVDSDSLLVLNERIVKGPSGIVTVKLVAGKTTKLMKVTIRPDDSTDASVSVSDPDGKNSPLLSLISAGEENRKKFIINLPCEEDKLVINTTLTDSTSSFDLTYGTDGVLAGDDATVVYTSPKKITLSNIPEGKAFTVSVQVKAENGDKLVYEYTIEREKAPVVEEDVTITVQNESIQVKVGGDYIKAKDILEGTGATASTTGGKTVSVAVDSDDLLNLNEKMIKGTTGSCDVYLYAGNAQAKITVDIQPVGNTAIGVQVSDPVGSYEPECSDPVRTKQANTRQYSITLPYYETAVKIDLTLDQNASVSDEYGENGLETDLKQTATAEKTTDTSITVSHVAVGDNGKISLKVVVDENTYMIYEFAITRDDCSDAEFEKSANTPSFRKSTTGFVKENDIITTGEVKAKDKNGTELKVTVDNNDLLILNERLQNDIAGKVSIKLYAGNTKGSIDVMVLADDNTDAQIAVTDPDETYFPRVKGTEVKDGKTTYKLLLPSGEDKLKIETKLAKTTSSFDQTYGTNGINTTSLKTGIAIAADSPSSIVLSDIPEGECGSVSIKVVAADETSMIYEFMISREKAPEVEPEKTVIISLEVSDFEIEAGSVILYSSDFEEKAKISCTDTEDNKVAYEINADDLINLNNEIKDVSKKEDRTVAVKVTTGKITKTVKVKVTPKKEDAGGEGQDGQDDQGKENDNPDGTDIVDPDGKGQDNPDDQIDDKPQKQTVVTITAEDFEVELGSNTLTVDEIIKRANASAKDDEGKTVEMNVQMFDLITLNSYIEGDKEREYSLTIYAGSAKKTITVKLVPKKQTEKKEDSEKKADEETKESSEAPAETKEQTVETKVEDDAFVIELSKTIAVKDKYRFTFVGVTKKDSVTYRSSKKKIATVSKKGVVVGKKVGTTVITAIIKKGTFSYKVKLNLKVVKATNAMDKLISIKKKGLMKKTGKLPELNVYEAVNAGKNIKLKFSNLAKDAKLECVSDNKNVKIAKLSLSKKKKTATITVKGQKRGFSHVTVKVNQGGRFYYVRYLIRVKSGKWTLKQLKTYLN